MTGHNLNFKHRVAVVGAGLTLFRRRMLETPQELAGSPPSRPSTRPG
jgi:acetyl-CoA C-acetyltransferase